MQDKKVTQEWRDVPGYVGCYEVSNDGQVRSLIRLNPSAHAEGKRRIKKILKQNVDNVDRLSVALSIYGEVKRHRVHRLVLLAFGPPMPFEGAECRHMDGDHRNNNDWNLEWGTHKQNMQDKTLHGTQPRGQYHSNAKLDENCVREIRKSESTTRQLARLYGVSQVAIHFIKARKTWKHVEDL